MENKIDITSTEE